MKSKRVTPALENAFCDCKLGAVNEAWYGTENKRREWMERKGEGGFL